MQFSSGKFTRSALGAGAAAVALLGVGGAALAQGGAPAAPSADQSQHQSAHHGKKHGKKHHPLAGVQHGEFTKTTKQGDKTFALQRGTVVSADANGLTVRSKDGFTATYAVDQTTKVHKERQNAPITEVKPGERVGVRAVKDGARTVAHQVHDSGPPKPQQPQQDGQ